MKSAVIALAVFLIPALPAQAQRSGGFSGHAGAARGSSGARISGPPRAAPPVRGFRPGTGPVVRVFLPRQNFRPAPVVRVLAGGPAVSAHLVRRPAFGVQAPTLVFRHRRFHRFHAGFGLPFCQPVFAVGFATRHFGVFHRELSCFPAPFFQPFFFGFPVVAAAPFLPLAGESMYGTPLDGFYDSSPEHAAGQTAQDAQSPPQTITLLQLKDGSMYGLVDYWIENGRLHYVTSYGGENSVPLERIDLDRTVQLNSERGVEFVLRLKPSNR